MVYQVKKKKQISQIKFQNILFLNTDRVDVSIYNVKQKKNICTFNFVKPIYMLFVNKTNQIRTGIDSQKKKNKKKTFHINFQYDRTQKIIFFHAPKKKKTK